MKRSFLKKYAAKIVRLLDRPERRDLVLSATGNGLCFVRRVSGCDIHVEVSVLDRGEHPTCGISVSSPSNIYSCFVPVAMSFPLK